ncbi:MAG: TonB family protein [Campylobacterales bacterium]|nr:TonB family protein [Campylobacterales bacterium]
MIRSHYFSSFAITSALYLAGGLALIWLWNAKPFMPKASEEVIKVALISPPKPVVKPKPIPPVPTPPKPKVEEPKKVEPKPKPKPKPKKVVKKVQPQPTPKPVVQPVTQYEPIVPIEPKAVEIVQPAPPPPPPKIDLSAKKRLFLKNVRQRIYERKKYPIIAKRRNIQGRVHVVFDIAQGGQISNIRTSGGSKILQRAARQSVLDSAPFSIPNALNGEFPMHNVSINIDFKLQ